MVRRLMILAVIAIATVCVAAASAGRDPLAGVWVAYDAVGDQSTDRYIIGLPDTQGVRKLNFAETSATFCGGAPLNAKGTATLNGSDVTLWLVSWTCGNGDRGVFQTPLLFWQGELDGNTLDLGPGYYEAIRAG